MIIDAPKRVTHSYVQTIEGTPEEIFPLYCPVKETLWCEGWDPVAVYSGSGVVEPDCVFTTEENGIESAWYVTVYDFEQGQVEMVKHTPGVTILKLIIKIEPVSGKKTRATISYGLTSLGRSGDEVLKAFTKESYDRDMAAWETAMNHYLKTGEMLTGLPKF
ncbi:MAG: hypothetical protein MI802_23845 [Desulfobacterales bacterium]|nr:hypothetical protein [Desulfobacterales bacterium]